MNPIFIVGVGRSGTSLLQSLLNAHPQVAFLPETQFLRRYVLQGRWARRKRVLPVEKALQLLEQDTSFSRAGVEVRDAIEPVADDAHVDMLGVYRQLAVEYLRRSQKSYVGDKDPRLVDYIRELRALFPESKLIQIHRDPRDVALSKTKARWSAHRPYWEHIAIGHAQLVRGLVHGPRYFGSDYHLIRYESLIEQPQQVLEDVSEFLSVPFDIRMMDPVASARGLVAPDEMDWKKETLQPIQSGNAGKWKSELTRSQIRFAELIDSHTMHRLGYHPAGAHDTFPRGARVTSMIIGAILTRLYSARLAIEHAR